MTQPLLAHQTPWGRMYSRAPGGVAEVPSITTVISQGADTMHGWHGYMAAKAVVEDPRLQHSRDPRALRTIARDASDAAVAYRDAAAERGDRVHFYCEQRSLEALGLPHERAMALEQLKSRGEEAFALQFDAWWDLYDVRPVHPEITIWNSTVGYAGTLDLVATIGGRLCLIDFKTKNTDRHGRIKALSDNVVMQLAAGCKAEECLPSEVPGASWGPWPFSEMPILLGVGIGETEVATMMADPEALPTHWAKFCALKRVWDANKAIDALPAPLRSVPPPVRNL